MLFVCKSLFANARAMAAYENPLAPGMFMAGFECASHRRADGARLDLIAATKHDTHAFSDYRSARMHGLRGVRDGLRWHLIERAPGEYDWSSWLPMLDAARRAGVRVTWDLWHFGAPDFIDPFDTTFAWRFAAFARSAAEVHKAHEGRAPSWCPLNEMSFFAHAAGEAGFLPPGRNGEGDVLKRALAGAAVAGARALRAVDPHCRLLWAEPLIAIAPRSEDTDARSAARDATNARYEVWDMIAGRLAPELGGAPDLLDIVGCNFYPHNQWYDGEGPTIPMGHHAYYPLSSMLGEVHARYGRPLVVSETGAEGSGRAAWMHYVCQEVRDARAGGAPVGAICLYPATAYPGWDDSRHCDTGLFGEADAGGARAIDARVAAELHRQLGLFRCGDALPGRPNYP